MFSFKLRYFNSSILVELNARFGLLQKGMTVIELGSGNGDWTRAIRKSIESKEDNPKLFAVDEVAMPRSIRNGVVFIQGDPEKKNTLVQLQKQLDLHPVDLVLLTDIQIISNLEAATQNDRDIDNFTQINLNRVALNIAIKTLKTGGTMLIKARDGEPEQHNFRFMRLFFRELIKIRPQTVQMHELKHYYLGLGFKQRDEYLKYPAFFQKVLNNKEDELLEEEIPPSFQTEAERDLEVLEFLDYAAKNQIACTNDQIEQIKKNPRYKNINWDKYPLFIVEGPLTEYQQQMQVVARYNGRLSFSPNTRTVEEDMKLGQELVDHYDSLLEEKDKSNALLEDDEILGQDEKAMTEEVKEIKQQLKTIDKEVEEGTFQISQMDDKEKEGLQEWMDKQTADYLIKTYKGLTPEQIIQREIAQGNASTEELREYFDMSDDKLISKANRDYEYHMTKRAEKINQNMTKEHRQEYYSRKKSLKTRRQ